MTGEIMKKQQVEKVEGIGIDTKATEMMIPCAAQDFRFLTTKEIGSHLIIIFERDQ